METPSNPDDKQPGPPSDDRLERMAAEAVAQATDTGEPPDLQPWLDELSTEPERAELAGLVEYALRGRHGLQRPLGPGVLVGGRYRLRSEIGAGGMGRVFAAFDEELEREVALKVLSTVDASDPQKREMFMKESRTLAALQHPGIVAVHDSNVDGDPAFIAMDLVDGRALDRVLAEACKLREDGAGGLDGELLGRAIGGTPREGHATLLESGWWRSVARIMTEIARTIEAAHGAGVLHRDLKPGNVMLESGGRPVVLDFGLASNLQEPFEGEVTQGLYGSIAFMAPEQVRDHRVGNDPRTDVYQLGLILYELLTLRRTFPGDSVGEVIRRVEHGVFDAPRKINSDVPRDLEAICLQAMEFDPRGRYGTVGELREDLERYLEGAEPRAARASALRSAWRRVRYGARRRPAVAGSIGIVLAVLVSVGLYASLFAGSDAIDIVRALAFRPATQELIELQDGDEVEPEDFLCTEIEVHDRAFVYTFSLYREDEDGPLMAVPYRPRLLQDVIEELARPPIEPEDETSSWSLPLEVGTHPVFVTYAEHGNATEGLLVMVSSRPELRLETWMQAVDERLDTTLGTGVPYTEVERMFPSGEVRGGRLAELPAKRRAELADTLSGVSIEDLLAGEMAVKRARVLFRVAPD